MNSFVVLCGFLALTSSLPIDEGVSLIQDNVGNYRLNYKTVDSTREEQGYDDGKVVGSYSFLDLNGTAHAIKYTADPTRGFLVEGNIPTQVTETPEVAAARAYHLAIVEQTKALLPELPEVEEEEEQAQVYAQKPIHAQTRPQASEFTRPVHVQTRPHAAAQFQGEKTIKLIAPKNIKLSPADLEALTAAIKAAKASNTPLENVRVVPSAKSVKVVEKKVEVDNSAEIEAAKAELFAAHRAAINNLANEYRKISLNKNKQ